MSRIFLEMMESGIDLTDRDFGLGDTTLLEEVNNQEIKSSLTEYYSNPNQMYCYVGSLLNSIYTNHSITFLFSRSIFTKILINDKNIDLPKEFELSSKHYIKILNGLTNNNNFLGVIKPYTRNKAGVYKITMKSILNEMYKLNSQEFFIKQEQDLIRYYDGKDKQQTSKISLESISAKAQKNAEDRQKCTNVGKEYKLATHKQLIELFEGKE